MGSGGQPRHLGLTSAQGISMRRAIRNGFLTLIMLSCGCLPYTVGSTARTVAPGRVEQTASLFVIPGAFDAVDSVTPSPLPGMDAEARFGLSQDADLGVRLTSGSGIMLSVKKRLTGQGASGGTALEGGAGILNFGAHLGGQVTFLVSGSEQRQLVPFGGLRAIGVIPLDRHAVSDDPSLGAFLGLRIGSRDLGVSPEIGVYRDPSALAIRRGEWIVVPAISIHGDVLRRILRPW